MAQRDQDNFTPTEFITSKLRFYSIGIVAANKALGSHEIEVTPVEELPMLDGELNDHQTAYNGKGADALGKAYSSTVATQVTLKASWLRLGSANRLTSPDVRRGEAVMIYQFGDADKYYWVVLKDDSKLRKLETVIWAISATTDEGKPTDASNSYYFEVSSHNKVIHLHTSKANGEPFEYDIQINTKDGHIGITDDIGNFISLDSAASRLQLHNSSDSHFDMNKGALTITTNDSVTVNTKAFAVNASTVNINGSSTISVAGGNVSISGATVDIT